ncbi:MAG: sigma-70 family RNA polymerase sigma factor [Polyangiales bacterium]
MTSALPDTLLMERAAGGDVDAFAEVYDRHAPTVLALLRRLLGPSADAQDTLHDVFLEAWRGVRSYDPSRGSVHTWLTVRARSRALDRRARAAREAHCPLVQRTAAALEPRERQLAVRQALSQLAPQVRETLELTYFEGLTAPELSARMNVPEGTVRSRLHRGLDALKPMLQLQAEEPLEPRRRRAGEAPGAARGRAPRRSVGSAAR